PCREEDDREQHFQRTGAFPFGPEELREELPDTDFLQTPDNPAHEKHERHGKRHVDVRIRSTEQRFVDDKVSVCVMTPADRTHAWNEANPVRRENEDENRREEPERPLDKMCAEDPFQKVVETFNHP